MQHLIHIGLYLKHRLHALRQHRRRTFLLNCFVGRKHAHAEFSSLHALSSISAAQGPAPAYSVLMHASHRRCQLTSAHVETG